MVKAEVPEAQDTAGLINNLILASQKLLADHPINQKRIAEGKDPANSIRPWSPGYRPQMEPLFEKYPAIQKGSVISAVDLILSLIHIWPDHSLSIHPQCLKRHLFVPV